MAETIQDWIISLKYQVDEQSARRVEDIARRLRAGQEVTSQEMREFEKGMKGLARTHETSMRQMSQSAQQHGQKFSTVVNQVIHPSLTKITAALGALSTAVGGFKAFEGVVKNLQQVGDLSRDLNVTALSLNALDKSLQNIGANRGTAASLVTTLQDAVQRNRGNLVLLQGMGVTARENAERVIELSRFVKREAAANRFDIAVQRLAEIGYSVADVRRLLALSEEDYRRQQGIRRRWKQDSADDIATAQKLRREWGDLMSNMEGVQSAIFVPMMTSITKIIGKVNKLIEGHEGEIRAFFTAIVEPIGKWAEGKADDMIAYMEKLIGPKGAQERAAWVKWWQDTKKETNDVVRDVLAIVHGVSEAIQLLSRLNRARRENIERVENEEIDRAESARRDQQTNYKPGFPGKQVPARHRPYTGLERFMRHLPYGEELLRRNREIAEVREAEAASPSVNTTAPTAPIGGPQQQIQRQQEEEVRATRDNTEEVKKNTQELQEQRRSGGFLSFLGRGLDQIKNLVGAGGTQGAGEGGPPDISGRGAGGGGGGGGGGTAPETGRGTVGGRVDRGGFESNPAGGRELAKGAGSAILDAISKAEGTHEGYRDSFGHQLSKRGIDITKKSLDEVLQIQNSMIRPGSSSAIGRYQFMQKTLRGLKSQLGLTGQEKFDQALQDRLGRALLEGQGYSSWRAGKITDQQFMGQLAKVWAGVTDAAGRSVHAGTGLNRQTASTVSAMQAAFGKDKSGYSGPVYQEPSEGAPTASDVKGQIAAGGVSLHQALDSPRRDLLASNISNINAYKRYLNKDDPERVGRGGSTYRPAGPGSTSQHARGRAIDLRAHTPAEADKVIAEQRAIMARFGMIEGKDFQLLDEVRHPSGGATAPHVHLSLSQEGSQKLGRAMRGEDNIGREGQRPGPGMGLGNNRPIDTGANAPPIATPSNVANDNSRSVTQHNEYKTTINAEDARGAASIFKGAAENINRINMSQIKGVIR